MATVALVGCGVHGGGDQSGRPTITRSASAPALDGKGVLAALRPAVAFVETPAGSGIAVLVDGGYLVTNAHVVEPSASVTLTFDGGKPMKDVPVVGLDLTADLAVVGPVKTRASAATFGDPIGLEKGDDLYLVGYPGDQENDRDLTIARGLLSRRRTAGDWKLQYLQSDAKMPAGRAAERWPTATVAWSASPVCPTATTSPSRSPASMCSDRSLASARATPTRTSPCRSEAPRRRPPSPSAIRRTPACW